LSSDFLSIVEHLTSALHQLFVLEGGIDSIFGVVLAGAVATIHHKLIAGLFDSLFNGTVSLLHTLLLSAIFAPLFEGIGYSLIKCISDAVLSALASLTIASSAIWSRAVVFNPLVNAFEVEPNYASFVAARIAAFFSPALVCTGFALTL